MDIYIELSRPNLNHNFGFGAVLERVGEGGDCKWWGGGGEGGRSDGQYDKANLR